MFGRRVVFLFVAIALLCTASAALAQAEAEAETLTLTPEQRQDIGALVQVIDGALMADVGIGGAGPSTPTPLPFGQPDRGDGDVPVTWVSAHFIKGQQGRTYMPFTIGVDRARLADGAALLLRIVSAEQAAAFAAAHASVAATLEAPTTYAWDEAYFIDVPAEGQFGRAVELPPGRYVAYVGIKPTTPAAAAGAAGADAPAPQAGPSGLLRHEITVPDYAAPGLKTSSIILARSIEPLAQPLPPAQQAQNPYVLGTLRIEPSVDGSFTTASQLRFLFWVYGLEAGPMGKPDVTLEYVFHRRVDDGETYFNKTQPQTLNAETLPPQFSLEAGHQVTGGLEIPLSSFPAGAYRLEITVTDNRSGSKVVESVGFTVQPA